MKVCVVGAGLGGLAAAVELRARGAEVEVWDPDGAGGKARTLRPRPDWAVENGPHSFTGRADEVFSFAEALGLADQLVKYPGGARYIVRGGKLAKAPLPALSLGELWGLFRGLFRTRSPAPEETLDAFLRGQFGAAVADGFGQVASVGVWAAGTDRIELRAGFPKLWEALQGRSPWRASRAMPKAARSGMWGVEGGIGALTAAAAARVSGVRQRRAEGIEGPAWKVDGEGFDGVVVATDAPAAAALLAQAAPAAAAELGAIRYSPLVVAHWLGEAALPHGFGWLTHPGERRAVIGTIFSSDLVPSRAPAGRRAFTTMFGGADALELDDDSLRGLLSAEVERLVGAAPRIEELLLLRHPRAVALPEPGHLERVGRIRAALPRGLALAGAWCGSGAMPDAVAAGRLAAVRLIEGGSGAR